MKKEKLLKATHKGELNIGNLRLQCAVLEDGTRVLTQSSIEKALGRQAGSSKKRRTAIENNAGVLPSFLAANNLRPFISEDILIPATNPILYDGKSLGFKADLLPKICNVYLKARDEKALHVTQVNIVKNADILIRALATVGITALVDEATGYIKDKKKDEYKDLFYQFIRDDITDKYVKPLKQREDFWNGIYKIYGIVRTKGKNHPQFFGKFLRKYLYRPLLDSNGALLEIIDEKNPVITSKGGHKYRKNAMYQFLEKEVAFEEWKNNLIKIETVLEMATNKRTFDDYFNRVFKVKNTMEDMIDNLENHKDD